MKPVPRETVFGERAVEKAPPTAKQVKRSLASEIRLQTDQGVDIVNLLVKYVKGEEGASPRDRIDAAKILLERGFGKPKDETPDDGDELGQVDEATLEKLARALLGPPAPALPPKDPDDA